MSLFHHHKDADDQGGEQTYEVLSADRQILRYARDDFAEIVQSTDAEEVQRNLDDGWVILDERQVAAPGRGFSGEDLLVGIEGLRADGLIGHGEGETVTSYTLGLLREGAQGVPED
jgi:hypothetical protein